MAELIDKDEAKARIIAAKDKDRFAHPLSNYGSGRIEGYDGAIEVIEQMPGKEIEWITETRPKEPGYYLVTLESECGIWNPDSQILIPNGTVARFTGVRYYAAPNKIEDWAMEGENPEELHWTEQYGSAYGERVVAWANGKFLIPFKGNTESGKKYEFIGEDNQQAPDKMKGR